MRPIFIAIWLILFAGRLFAQDGFFADDPQPVVQKQPVRQATAKVWKIVMESIPNCGACKVSDSYDQPRYRAAGWQWETKHLSGPQPGVPSYPRYLLCNGDVCVVIQVNNTAELDGKVREALRRLAPQQGFKKR